MMEIAVYGAGGFAKEVAWLIETCSTPDMSYQTVCFIYDFDFEPGTIMNEIPLHSLTEARRLFPQARVIVGIGSPKDRQTVTEKALAAGCEFTTLIHPRTEMSRFVEIGTGTVICAGNILTTNIVIGHHVQVNLDCTIGHDVLIGDYTTLSPGVHVSGRVHLGKRVFVGSGAVIINGPPGDPLIIGDDVVIGAGACVTKSVPPGSTVVGVPAKPIGRR